jgi:hypothetical protein
MRMELFGITVGANLPTAVLCGHLVVACGFLAIAVLGLVSGTELLGVVLRGLTGVLVGGLGVSVARLV